MKLEAVSGKLHFLNKDDIGAKKVEKFSFSNFLSEAIDKVDQAEKVSNALDEELALGKIDNIHDAMIAAQKAEISLSLAMEIRSQVLEAYRELMRIQV